MMVAERGESGHRLDALLGVQDGAGAPARLLVTGLCDDSRTVRPGDAFFALPGLRTDARAHVVDALAAGARVAVVEGEAGAWRDASGTVVSVPDVRAALGCAADRFFGQPSRVLRVVGVTGTNGKTSVSHFVAQALDAAGGGARAGVIGTLGHGFPAALRASTLTTPGTLAVHGMLAELYASGASDVIMEVSSHALDQRRVEGVRFVGGVFTNLSRDHLDYHGDLETYGRVKAALFRRPDLGFAVLNLDDALGREIAREAGPRIRQLGYALDGAPGFGRAAFRARIRSADGAGIALEVEDDAGVALLSAPLLGRFNAANLLAALGTLVGLGMRLAEGVEALTGVTPPPGRMERFGGREGLPLVVVDYAHTPDALDKALEAVREHTAGRLWCVFGCGGDRDPGKRAQMGAVAAARADAVLITDDNPRFEDGDAIVAEILRGMDARAPQAVERDRYTAIRRAVRTAGPGDAVLVAGKGHESHQDRAGERRPFSDAAAVRRVLAEPRS
jgi:UDP-N-acetylmuramoyl-L-alanyl-D-glutamate--2,6-diaminopimelate ligase